MEKIITKSKYLQGIQCPKLLWVSVNDSSRIPELDSFSKAKLQNGNVIGDLAKKIFLDGIDLSGLSFEENLKATKSALKKRKPIFEAGFLFDALKGTSNLYSRCDILVPVGHESWDIIEVKSDTKVKDINLDDVSFQKYVYSKAGLKIRNCYIMHINNEYVKDGEIEPQELFLKVDVTEQINEYLEGIDQRISHMTKVINSKNETRVAIGEYCTSPYECPLKDECWKDVPSDSVFDFVRITKKNAFEMYNSGITKLADVGEEIKLNEKQKIQRMLAQNGGIHVNREAIFNFLSELVYPIYYLDFETVSFAIPKFDKTRPYNAIPFQYSLHIQDEKDGEVRHVSFLADGKDDPRLDFLNSLKENLGASGSILVYYQSFEKSRLIECSEAYPEFKKIVEKNFLPRIKDLYLPFSSFYYYNPEQKGSTSIKKVLPSLVGVGKDGKLNLPKGVRGYSDMEISKGDIASFEFEKVTYGKDVLEEEKLKVRKALEEYCSLDTFAEVLIVKELWKLSKEK